MSINKYTGPEQTVLKHGLSESPFYIDTIGSRFLMKVNGVFYPLSEYLFGATSGEVVNVAEPVGITVDEMRLPQEYSDRLLAILSTGDIPKDSISRISFSEGSLSASRNIPLTFDEFGHDVVVQGAFKVVEHDKTCTISRPDFDIVYNDARAKYSDHTTGSFEVDPQTLEVHYLTNTERFGGLSRENRDHKIRETDAARESYPKKYIRLPNILGYGGFTDPDIPEDAGWLIYERPNIANPTSVLVTERIMIEDGILSVEEANILPRALYQLLYSLRYAHDKGVRDPEDKCKPESVHLQLHMDNWGITNNLTRPEEPSIYIGDLGSAYTADNIPSNIKAVDVFNTLIKTYESLIPDQSDLVSPYYDYALNCLTAAIAGYLNLDEHNYSSLGVYIKTTFDSELQRGNNSVMIFTKIVNDVLVDHFGFPPLVPFYQALGIKMDLTRFQEIYEQSRRGGQSSVQGVDLIIQARVQAAVRNMYHPQVPVEKSVVRPLKKKKKKKK